MTSIKILAISLSLMVALTFCTRAYASTLSLNPESSTVKSGDTFTSQLTVDTQGDDINAVDVSISYPKELLQVNSVDQGSDFRTVADKNFGDGLIHFSAATLDPGSGELTVANGKVTVLTISFKALSGGSANVAISPDSAVVSETSGTSNLNGIQNAQYSISAPTPTPTDNSQNSTSRSSSSNQTTTQTTTSTSQQSCKNEDKIKTSLRLITSSGTVYEKKMDRISSLVASFYSDRLVVVGKSTATFSALENKAVAKGQAVQSSIAKLNKQADNFTCKTGNYQQLKSEYDALKGALLDYQKSIREMIQVAMSL
jgi:hypothetical protein